MKPLQIGLLIAAGAIGGILVMKVSQTPHPQQVAASTPIPATSVAPVATAEQPPAPEPAETPAAQPSPFPEKENKPVAHKPAAKKPAPVTVAQNRPPAMPSSQPEPAAAAVPAPAPAPMHEPPKEAPAPAPAPVEQPAPAPPPPPARVIIKPGTLLPVRLVEGLSTDRNTAGDLFTATLDQPLIVDGFVLAERGARLEGRVVTSEKAGKVKGLSSLAIELTRLNTSDGQKIAIQTDSFQKQGQSSKGEDVGKVGAAAGIGAAIGGIAGGGKGAGIGAIIGGAAGTGGVLATRGKATVLPSETRINFRLREPVTVTEKRH